jgi:hypothetical protein
MKTLSTRIAAAILVSLFVSSVDAQSPAPIATKKPTPVDAQSPAPIATKKPTPSAKTKSRIPPAPPIPMRSSRFGKTRNKPAMLGDPDPSGRKDLAGNHVPFYPISRGAVAKQNSASPIKIGKRITSGPKK